MRLDLAASILAAPTVAILEMGGAIAKRGFQATDMEVALLTSGQSLGLILSFFIAHLASQRAKMPLVFAPEALRSIALALVFFLKPTFALGFVACHAAAQMFQSMTIPARVTIYRLNYPSALRGRIVGRNRQAQLLLATIVALIFSAALEWSVGLPELVNFLGPPRVAPDRMISYLIPVIALLGLGGSLLFRSAPVREPRIISNEVGLAIGETVRRFVQVWREDREFRRYQNFFFLFGFANIMSIPLTQIHTVDVLHANYFDLALINVVLVQGLMALTMTAWGRLVDRYPPQLLRGILNLIFSVDLLLLALAPAIEWVYLGRAFRGIALGGGTLIWMLGSLYYARTPEQVPVYLGIHTVLTGVRWALAPFAGVWLKAVFSDHAPPVFFLSFLIVLLSALYMIWTAKDEPPRMPLDAPMPAPRTPAA